VDLAQPSRLACSTITDGHPLIGLSVEPWGRSQASQSRLLRCCCVSARPPRRCPCRHPLGLEGEVRSIVEDRLWVRRFDCPLIFHRECKGKPGQPITDFWEVWRNALQAARLPQVLRCRPRDAARSTQNGPARECVTAGSAFRSRASAAFPGTERSGVTGWRRASPGESW